MPNKIVQNLRYIIMKAKLIVPNKLSEITLRQYREFLKVQDTVEDNYILQCRMIEIFCKINFEAVKTIKLSEANDIGDILADMINEKPELVKSFFLNNIEYGFHPDLNDLTLGEYIDLDTFIGDWENIHSAMNVLYRPIKQRSAGRYVIADYDINNKELLLDMPMDAVISSIFFFFLLATDLSIVMSHYLQQETKRQQVLPQDLEAVGVGMDQYMNSLKEILAGLKISLN